MIGGGPAGLFCAARAASCGKRVFILEKNPSPGRKLLMTGAGQCNMTHEGDVAEFIAHYGDNGKFLKPALMNFQNRDLVKFFGERGLPVITEPGGRIFPAPRNSMKVLEVLQKACASNKVETKLGDPLLQISRKEKGFHLLTKNGEFFSENVVVATGGMTYPQTGSTGDGYAFARSLGHKVTDTGTALAPVITRDHKLASLSGISFAEASVSLYRGEKKLAKKNGDLLITHTGLSGPVILDLSRFIRKGDTLKISFIRDLNEQQADEMLLTKCRESGSRQVRKALLAFGLPERFAEKLLEVAGIDRELTGAQLSKESRSLLAGFLAGFPMAVGHLGGVEEAMVTRGGVALDEVNSKTMGSRLVPGLYFIGEVLDIDGDTGGYNLQAAFSTAALAARSIVQS